MNETIPINACQRCGVGRLHPRKVTYTMIHEGMLISLQNMLAQECDICDFQDFDAKTIWQLDALIGEFNTPQTEGRFANKLASLESDVDPVDLPQAKTS